MSYENYEAFQDDDDLFRKIDRILKEETTGQGKEERSSLSLQDRLIVLSKRIKLVEDNLVGLEAYIDYLLFDVERLDEVGVNGQQDGFAVSGFYFKQCVGRRVVDQSNRADMSVGGVGHAEACQHFPRSDFVFSFLC